jgi:hypothetical protein
MGHPEVGRIFKRGEKMSRNFAILFLAALPFAAAVARDWDDVDFRYDDHESIHRSFNLAGAPQEWKLTVNNVSGRIHVTGYDGNELKMDIDRHNMAESKDRLAEAKRRITLEISQSGGEVRVYEDGPFRNGDDGINYRGDRHYGYRVDFNYEIQVPRAIALHLHNFNHGPIEVANTSGEFDIHDFNSGITMNEVAGFGNIHTFNGPVKVTFSRNPEHDTSFKTFNGSIDVYFRPDLNADLQFKTFNGGVYSDFELAPTPVQATGARFVYRSGRSGNGRIGKGGPKLTFQGFNGTIRLHSRS